MQQDHFVFIEKIRDSAEQLTWREVTKSFNERFNEALSPEALKKRFKRERQSRESITGDTLDKAVKIIKREPIKPTELARRLELDMDSLENLLDDIINSRTAIKYQYNYLVFDKSAGIPDNITHYLNLFEEGEWIKWGIISDSHGCSIYERPDLVGLFYKICEEEGVKGVLHAGDFTAGNGNVFKGQYQELKIIGVDKQIEYMCSTYPQTSLPTYVISGNHSIT